jgi:hypothetical protein
VVFLLLSHSYLSLSELPNWGTIFHDMKITGISEEFTRISPEVIVPSYIQRTIHRQKHAILRNPVTR